MTKQELLAPYSQNPERKLTLARLLDRLALCRDRDIPTYSNFLTPEERLDAERLLQRTSCHNAVFLGGFAEAERRLCLFLPTWAEPSLAENFSPISALQIASPAQGKTLGHRDYLGSLMGLGLSREKFGDILVFPEGGAVLLLLADVLDIVLTQWQSVGASPITLCPLAPEDLTPPQSEVTSLTESVASLRLDAVVAAVFSLGRKTANDYISQGKLLRNHCICDKATVEVQVGDVLSIRGKGRCILQEQIGQSKKGRILLRFDRYA